GVLYRLSYPAAGGSVANRNCATARRRPSRRARTKGRPGRCYRAADVLWAGTLTDQRPPSRATSGSVHEVDDEPLPEADREHLRCVAVGDRDRDVPVGVLVEDDVAGPGVGERAGRTRVVPVRAELQLDPTAGDDPGLLHVRPGQVELNVPVPVDVEDRGDDPRLADLGCRQLEPDEGPGLDRGAELCRIEPNRKVSRRGCEHVATVERP